MSSSCPNQSCTFVKYTLVLYVYSSLQKLTEVTVWIWLSPRKYEASMSVPYRPYRK
ncbi:hypothetical protein COLO4_06454 [Corchorus olitorius]|uniref:Uncharacterized protein n=1 Tax=Corchorus olitorius TaxID=93759 RepID=A0A1R3KMZ4_9ROSI|nr:hypothetical protein COLO4_06454 [Corchorus olitorius]